MWRRIYQRKLLFWIGMYLSIAFGSALQGFTQHQPIYVWTANVVFSLLIVFLWHKFSGYIQEVRGHSLQDKLILVFLFALSNVMLACSAWQSLGYLWLLPVIMVSIGSGIEQSVILFIALLSQNLLLHSASFSARRAVDRYIFRVCLHMAFITRAYRTCVIVCWYFDVSVGKCITDIAASVYAAVNIARV